MKTKLLTIVGLLAFAPMAHAGEWDIQKEVPVSVQFEKIGAQTISWLEAEEILTKESARIGAVKYGITADKIIAAYADRIGPEATEVSFADLISFVNDLNNKLISDGPSRGYAPSDGPSYGALPPSDGPSHALPPSDGPSRSVAPSDGPSVAIPPSDGPSFSKVGGLTNTSTGFKAPHLVLTSDGPSERRKGFTPQEYRPQDYTPAD